MNEYEERELKKHEGAYTEEEAELNKRLYTECSRENADFELIEELLKRGADPLGGTAARGWDLLVHVYGELVLDSLENENIDLPRITELFLKYGMDVDHPRVPYDNENSIHVLRYLPENEGAIRSLKMLLDNGVGADAVAEYWDRFIFDEFNVHFEDPNGEEWNGRFIYAMKMIMLMASYDHILNNDEDLRRIVCRTDNTYDVHNFRDWDDYRYEFDTSRCKLHPCLGGTVVNIYHIKTGEKVWEISFLRR